MPTEKEVPLADQQRFPTHRHLRRVAEAVAGLDEDTDVWAIVQISDQIPFNCEVFDDEQQAVNAAVSKPGRWVVIPAHSEVPDSDADRFFAVTHDVTSPTETHTSPDIERSRIRGFRLIVEVLHDDGKIHDKEIDLSSHLRHRPTGPDKWPAHGNIDAVFFSVEAMDKYMFPNLVMTYGTRGANTLRQRALKQLKEQGVNLKSELSDFNTVPATEMPA